MLFLVELEVCDHTNYLWKNAKNLSRIVILIGSLLRTMNRMPTLFHNLVPVAYNSMCLTPCEFYNLLVPVITSFEPKSLHIVRWMKSLRYEPLKPF